MALETRRRRPNIAPATVALQTGGVAVGAGKREARELMVEGDLRPAVGGMAGAAVTAELAGMSIVVLMAANAIRCRAHIRSARVAIHTGGVDVGAGQLEDRTVVIENEVFPGCGDMALAAVNQELTVMRIILDVAAGTDPRDADPLALDMAGFARQRRVCPDHIKAG